MGKPIRILHKTIDKTGQHLQMRVLFCFVRKDENMATKKKATPEKEIKTATVFGGALNIRQEPDTTSAVLGTLEDGSQIMILEDLGEWLRTNAGYVMAKWVKQDA